MQLKSEAIAIAILDPNPSKQNSSAQLAARILVLPVALELFATSPESSSKWKLVIVTHRRRNCEPDVDG